LAIYTQCPELLQAGLVITAANVERGYVLRPINASHSSAQVLLIPSQCDQLQPTCSRCQKLGIPCVGGGLQRFIFKTHDVSKLVKSSRPDLAISQMPSSPAMAVSMSLIDKIQNRHLRFEINWAHGSFLDDVPRRLSHNQALAAATEAFMLSIPCADVPHTLLRRRLRSYASALHATRVALSNPVEAYSLNTLCAVYLLWVCQVCRHPVVRTDWMMLAHVS
jgi:hypothetical protein